MSDRSEKYDRALIDISAQGRTLLLQILDREMEKIWMSGSLLEKSGSLLEKTLREIRENTKFIHVDPVKQGGTHKRRRLRDMEVEDVLRVVCPSCRAPVSETCEKGAVVYRVWGKMYEGCHTVRWTSAAETMLLE